MGTIQNATYGRSEAGLKELKSNIQSNCQRMISALSGSEYKTLLGTVKQYWAGADADDWLKDFDKTIKDLTSLIKKQCANTQGYLDQDLAQFKSFQAKNVTK